MKRAAFAEILSRLTAHDVEFIVVGMTAGVLQGVPVTTIDQGRGYDELLPEAIEMTLADGQAIRVLGLTGLIDAKERAGRPKDLAALPVLRATLDEARRRK